ncbi:MAG: CpsB/CapC family capsule biosynthesis tyrosine phosphatase [Brumimicrobium sp.]|nr:CpsB/CapC family capsule biosynthesis tyrosine phosphatase [Brumimicrobium sp.]
MNIFKSLFGTKSKEIFDLNELKVDMHSHLIPGIDDGSQSMDETVEMLLRFVELGYVKVVTTPHIMQDHYPNTKEIIIEGVKEVRKTIIEENIPIEIEAAAEYYFDEFLFDKIKNGELLTFGDNYVLFEFSFATKPNNIDQLIFDFKSNNYKPVLAHFERYGFFLENGVEEATKLRDKGVLIQMNLSSLTGHYGKAIQKQAELLIDHKLIDFVGTDCHRLDHLETIANGRTLKYFNKLGDLDLLNRKLYN